MFKVLGIIVILGVVAILVFAATKPASFRVERSITVAAPPSRIIPLVADFHEWDQWSPWAKLDSKMKVEYSGARSGPGAMYDWEGNSKVGKGHMEILSATPEKISVKLDFLKPFEGHNTLEFLLMPEGNTTRIGWVMYGPNTYMGKVMSVFTSMDKMIGPDFDRGLANLKDVAER